MTIWQLEDKELKGILYRNNDLSNENVSVEKTIAELLLHIKNTSWWKDLESSTIKQLEEAKTFHTLNQALNKIYDFADDNKIWLGFMPID